MNKAQRAEYDKALKASATCAHPVDRQASLNWLNSRRKGENVTAKWYIFTIWVDDGVILRRFVLRLQGRPDEPNHESLKQYVKQQLVVSYGSAAVVEFGPIGLSKRQD